MNRDVEKMPYDAGSDLVFSASVLVSRTFLWILKPFLVPVI